nr:hypothetical protein [uncultured Blautia sp.]
MDSIRENRTKEDFAAELNMLFNQNLDGSLCVVLVEGADDVRFMESVLEDNVVCEEVPYGGKHGIDDIMKMEDPSVQKKEVIAIRDKDYIDATQLPDRVFLYDGCCLETMLLMNLDIAEEFYKKNYSGCFEKDVYLVNIMRQLAPYSILRKLNELGNFEIPFSKVGFGDLIDGEILKIEELFIKVGQLDRLSQCMELAASITDSELWNITNGHDFCRYLSNTSRFRRKQLDESGVREILFELYRKSDFKRTRLYCTMLEYQRRNTLKFVSE